MIFNLRSCCQQYQERAYLVSTGCTVMNKYKTVLARPQVSVHIIILLCNLRKRIFVLFSPLTHRIRNIVVQFDHTVCNLFIKSGTRQKYRCLLKMSLARLLWVISVHLQIYINSAALNDHVRTSQKRICPLFLFISIH